MEEFLNIKNFFLPPGLVLEVVAWTFIWALVVFFIEFARTILYDLRHPKEDEFPWWEDEENKDRKNKK